MKTAHVIIEHAGENLSAYVVDAPIFTVGNSIDEIKANIQQAVALYLDDNPAPCTTLSGAFQLAYSIDAPSFIRYYSRIFTKSALARITGINERQLWYYSAGLHKPRKAQIERIQNGIHRLACELEGLSLN